MRITEALWLACHLDTGYRAEVSVHGKGKMALTLQTRERRVVAIVDQDASAREVFDTWNQLIFQCFVEPQLTQG